MAPRSLILYAGLSLAIVGVVVSLATGNWWFLAIALLLHLVGSAIALLPVFKVLNQGEKPDPVTEARLAEEGETADDDEQPAF